MLHNYLEGEACKAKHLATKKNFKCSLCDRNDVTEMMSIALVLLALPHTARCTKIDVKKYKSRLFVNRILVLFLELFRKQQINDLLC